MHLVHINNMLKRKGKEANPRFKKMTGFHKN